MDVNTHSHTAFQPFKARKYNYQTMLKTERSLKSETQQIERRIKLYLTLFHLSFFFLVSFLLHTFRPFFLE